MHEKQPHFEEREAKRQSSFLTWTLGTAAVAIALVADRFWPGWGRPVVLTLAIFGTIIGFGRNWWGTAFWTAITASFAVHVPLVLHFRAAINRLPMSILFVFAAVEVVVICGVMGKAVSRRNEEG